jgi:hypothetical protein
MQEGTDPAPPLPSREGTKGRGKCFWEKIYKGMTFFCQEGNTDLPKTSVAVATQMATVDKGRLLQKIGTLIPPNKLGIEDLNGMES